MGGCGDYGREDFWGKQCCAHVTDTISRAECRRSVLSFFPPTVHRRCKFGTRGKLFVSLLLLSVDLVDCFGDVHVYRGSTSASAYDPHRIHPSSSTHTLSLCPATTRVLKTPRSRSLKSPWPPPSLFSRWTITPPCLPSPSPSLARGPLSSLSTFLSLSPSLSLSRPDRWSSLPSPPASRPRASSRLRWCWPWCPDVALPLIRDSSDCPLQFRPPSFAPAATALLLLLSA